MAYETTFDILTYFDESCHNKLSTNFLPLKSTELGFPPLNICSYLQSD